MQTQILNPSLMSSWVNKESTLIVQLSLRQCLEIDIDFMMKQAQGPKRTQPWN